MEKVLDNVSFIFKVGDDLRQVNQSQVMHAIIFLKKDCLMIQMLGVMENLWKCKNLDLKMTRYQASKISQLKRKYLES